MIWNRGLTIGASVAGGVLLIIFVALVSRAQQTIVEPGAPGATTTIPGGQLPPPPPAFRGPIEPNAAQSKPYSPPRVVPPNGAPSVLLIMTESRPRSLAGGAGSR